MDRAREHGLAAISMRELGARVGLHASSLYQKLGTSPTAEPGGGGLLRPFHRVSGPSTGVSVKTPAPGSYAPSRRRALRTALWTSAIGTDASTRATNSLRSNSSMIGLVCSW